MDGRFLCKRGSVMAFIRVPDLLTFFRASKFRSRLKGSEHITEVCSPQPHLAPFFLPPNISDVRSMKMRQSECLNWRCCQAPHASPNTATEHAVLIRKRHYAALFVRSGPGLRITVNEVLYSISTESARRRQ